MEREICPNIGVSCRGNRGKVRQTVYAYCAKSCDFTLGPTSHQCPPLLRNARSLARDSLGHPVFKKSCMINSSAVARLFTSTQRQTDKNALSSLDNFSGFFRRGVPCVAIKYSALSGSSFRYGGSDSIISMAMMPNDQMSTFEPYSFCLTTSGAIQYGVPTIVARLLRCSVSLAQKPKSAGFKVSCCYRKVDERPLTDLDISSRIQ
jgi:hypothetical protein